MDDSILAEGCLKVPAAAEFLGLSRSKVYDLMKDGRLPFSLVDGLRLIPRRALVALLRNGLAAATADYESAGERERRAAAVQERVEALGL